eukprot:CAMPEP_0198427710 /NCGR_PEP_ID=MMETSP1452-20131203/6090_1 /TAXON_ID=1181717 /ORGANISM="Synchroma pusillum, Strain CCMP3072" /LENGTH=126 /DNA_ID=CAMNT_0044148085 /DNA_START=196 /DNA_END=573 /DNA_ORIENTATION=-
MASSWSCGSTDWCERALARGSEDACGVSTEGRPSRAPAALPGPPGAPPPSAPRAGEGSQACVVHEDVRSKEPSKDTLSSEAPPCEVRRCGACAGRPLPPAQSLPLMETRADASAPASPRLRPAAEA